jgi:hypothetical protein
MTRVAAVFTLAAFASFPAAAAHRMPGAAHEATAVSINASAPSGRNDSDPSLIAKAEVLLDRDHFSPGELYGLNGDNYRRAVRAFQQANNLPATGILDADTWTALISNASKPVLKSYTITDGDLAGPFDKQIPVGLAQMAEFRGLSCTSPPAELAEKFHMNMEFLRKLNPRADFERPGQEIAVADVKALDLRAGRDTFGAVPPGAANESVATLARRSATFARPPALYASRLSVPYPSSVFAAVASVAGKRRRFPANRQAKSLAGERLIGERRGLERRQSRLSNFDEAEAGLLMTGVTSGCQLGVGRDEFGAVLRLDGVLKVIGCLRHDRHVRSAVIRVKALRVGDRDPDLRQLIIGQRPVLHQSGIPQLEMPELCGDHHVVEPRRKSGLLGRRFLIVSANRQGSRNPRGDDECKMTNPDHRALSGLPSNRRPSCLAARRSSLFSR